MDGKPSGVRLAQGLLTAIGLVAVLWYVSACMTLVGFEDYKEPGRTAAFWRLAGFLVLMVVCSVGGAVGLSSRRPRVGWWLGMAAVLGVAMGGVAILSAPRWAAHTDLTPARLVWGLLVLLLAGVLLTALLAPATRRWVNGEGVAGGPTGDRERGMIPGDRGVVAHAECGECGKPVPGQVGACPHCGSFLRVDRGADAAGAD